ncbi:LDCC motif putative metal-binding protein [Propionigenium maris]|nr:LDCC motif putative metal-binding protein [Propionigenium maris]
MKKLKQIFTRLIRSIGKENEKNFGSKRIDCCNVNKK